MGSYEKAREASGQTAKCQCGDPHGKTVRCSWCDEKVKYPSKSHGCSYCGADLRTA